ncbi:GTPase IMAP family member 7-like [Plectropomus leopardus]|uniref:GTPase IMAP family member 7-like n=1 Tax=Plectropomus leopardus TaxID=160734 RepID=UPI001C4D498D|nr:GTPase IMAP family member 7-like [Plectropomus leopardus]
MDASSSRRIVVVGKTGAGKSSLANTVFGETAFTVDDSPNSGTSRCQAHTKFVHGRSIMWVDTPGFFDTEKSEEELKKEIGKCVVECAPGPHAFLIVLQVNKFTKQEKDIVDKLSQYFSEEALKYTIVLFTHGDQLPEEMTIEQWVARNEALRDLVRKCGDRCHVVDNKHWTNNQQDEYRTNEFQVKELLKRIDGMIRANKESYYTNEMLQKCDRHIQHETGKITQAHPNMPREEIIAQAKSNVLGHWVLACSCIAAAVLLGIFFGGKIK